MANTIVLSRVAVYVPYQKQQQFMETMDSYGIPYDCEATTDEYFQTTTTGANSFGERFIFGDIAFVKALVSETTFITAWHLFKLNPEAATLFINSNIECYL